MIRFSQFQSIASLLIVSLALPTAAMAQATPESPPAPASPAAEEEAEITVLPKVKTLVEAVYPPKALSDRVYAEVALQIDIGTDGLVESSSVVSTKVMNEDGTLLAGDDAYGFAEAATIAVTQIEFHPAQAGTTPVPVRIGYTYKFQLPALAPVVIPAAASPAEGATPSEPAKAAQVNLSGTLLERGSRTPLAGITVLVHRGEGDEAVGFEAVTSASGRFEFFDLEATDWKIKIAPSGYRAYKTSETIRSGEGVDATYYVEKKSYNPYDVTVQGERAQKEVTRRTLSAAEIISVPGTLGDPVQAVENLPGVARPSFGSDQLSVRGSGTDDTGVFVSGAAIPLIYHFGGLKSVMPARVIESIDFYPGNYSVEYGRAMGGILDLNLKRLDPDRFHGTVDVSALDTSIYLEAPIGDKAAIAISGRRSYIDVVLGLMLPDDGDFAFKTAPRYYDYQVMGNYRPTDKHEFRAMFLGSDDRLKLVFDDPAELGAGAQSGALGAVTQFQRFLLEHRYVPTATFDNEIKLSIGRDQLEFGVFDTYEFDFDFRTVQLRDTARLKLSDELTLRAGLDSSLTFNSGHVLASRPAEEGQVQSDVLDPETIVYTEFDNRKSLLVAPFVEASIKLGDAELVPGVRMDYWGATSEYSVDPRIAARYNLSDNVAVKGGVAVVHQQANIRQLDPVFGNPDLELQRALQYSLGAEWQATPELNIDSTLFYKDLDSLASSTSETVERDGETVPLVLNNGGTGRVYGAELFVKRSFADNFHGWLSYTLMRSERKDFGSNEYRLFDIDQTHILSMVGSYTLPRNWEVGFRLRVGSGNPETPVIGAAFVDSADSYTPVYGEANSSRLSTFFQADLRVDKTWVFDTWKLAAYLSVINATNAKNAESTNYNFDYSEQSTTNGLPILPILGVKADW